jgi:hypothetical protein
MPDILTLSEFKLQLLLTFIILSIITLIAILLMMLSKNSRSQKVRTLCQQNNWQYQEYVNFTNNIKQANFGLLNYSQNIIFRHIISANDSTLGIGFNFFDCRSIEVMGIHNCSALLFQLNTPTANEPYATSPEQNIKNLHVCFSPKAETLANTKSSEAFKHSAIDKKYFDRIRAMQKLKRLNNLFAFDYAFPKHEIYTNNPALLENFLAQHIQPEINKETPLSNWFLAHPHLHIEISNGMLLAYQPNKILDDDAIVPAIEHLAELTKSLSSKPNRKTD